MDRILGCMMSGMCGDAAGASLEFYRGEFTPDLVKGAMRMPGGGALNIGPGQITDDWELSLALADVLFGRDPCHGFPADAVARAYSTWHKSDPFDIGGTCARAFGFIPDDCVSPALIMTAQAARYSSSSQANGALMRCTPIAVWARLLPDDVIAAFARDDARLSHPNKIAQDCNAAYCVAMSHLINNPGDSRGAIAAAKKLSLDKEVREWMREGADTQPTVNIGHVKHAFTLTFRFLRARAHVQDAMYETLLMGGDTDTNAAIVSAMLGALWGVGDIPDYMLSPVMEYQYDKASLLGYDRPRVYSAASVMALVRRKKL